jgi:formylglycine-generating enzyme required for sulfatase activity
MKTTDTKNTFQDAEWAPVMQILPRGNFWMGSPESEVGRDSSEGPLHQVSIAYDLAIGKYAVTYEEYDHYSQEVGLPLPHDLYSRGQFPVSHVSWLDTQGYLDWLNDELGLRNQVDAYRLPSEAEWEYACRAGTNTPFHFCDTIPEANHHPRNINPGMSAALYHGHPVSVGTFPPNQWGLHEMHGNVAEWIQDEWHPDYNGAPDDGRPWEDGQFPLRILRGGTFFNSPFGSRAAHRARGPANGNNFYVGFRVARALKPYSDDSLCDWI